MIMAIVVAAIPVENYGTMRASGIDGGPELAREASKYLTGTDNENEDPNTLTLSSSLKKYQSNVENPYQGDSETVQQIIGDRFIDAFVIRKKTNDTSEVADAMIERSVFIENLENFDIHETEYYGYVQMNAAYRQAVINAFNGETYSLNFSDTLVKYDEILDAGADGSLRLEEVTGYRISTQSPTQTITNSPGIPGTISGDNFENPYMNFKSAPSTINVLETYASDLLSGHMGKITQYNNTLDEYVRVLEEIKNKDKSSLTETDVKNWNDAKEGITQIFNENTSVTNDNNKRLDGLKEFSKSFADIYAANIDEDENGLPDILDYAICQRMGSDKSGGLEKYKLVRLINTKGDPVYVPQNKTAEGPDSGQRNDTNGYLAGGQVRIKGIKSDAFNVKDGNHPTESDKEVASVTIPASVEFIGARAFANSTYLKSVTITEDNCRILGDEAFRNCPNLSSVKFNSQNSRLEKVGCMAFQNTLLENITFPDYVTEIGAGCLYYSDIKELTIVGYRNGNLTIDPYAFFGCDKLEKVNFTSDNTTFQIETAAFALPSSQGGGALESFVFPTRMNQMYYEKSSSCVSDYILAGRENLKTVVLPGRLGNGVSGDATKVPDHTFAGCINLEWVEFPSEAYNATYTPADDGNKHGLFRNVLNPEFYVKGPAETASQGSKSEPRKCTWKATTGYILEDGSHNIVPYVYTGRDGKDHMEMGAGNVDIDDYIATIDIIEGTDNAILSGYEDNGSGSDSLAATIPRKVGKYTIKELGTGCFYKVKDKLYKLIISDGTVERINAGALEGCTKLQWVELGDSVKFIGDRAFGGCTSLENVVFSQTQTTMYGDGDWENNKIEIAPNAFHTGSEYLTFHGAIHPEYEPYRYAMSADAKNLLSGNTTGICYKTDAPLNLTVMRNEANGERTLIDYPHYEEIDVINKDLINVWNKTYDADGNVDSEKSDYSITDKFEEIEGLGSNVSNSDIPYGNYKSKGVVNEKDIVLNTLNVSLPRGIDSVDSKAFLTNEANTDNAKYLEQKYVPETKVIDGKEVEISIKKVPITDADRNLNQFGKGEKDVIKLYSTYEGKDAPEENTVAGLYSGYFDESAQETNPNPTTRMGGGEDTDEEGNKTPDQSGLIWENYNGHYYTENNNRGNDYLTTINLPDVVKLPDYAFDSCENLMTVTLSNSLTEVGALPFRDCKSLRKVDGLEGNNTFKSPEDSMMLYKNVGSTDSPEYEILECFEGRGGSVGGDSSVGVNESDLLPNITSIAQDAFSNCENIRVVDLTGTKVERIPAGCFEGCILLDSVRLPEAIQEIHDRSFTNLGKDITLKLYIPNKRCTLASGALDGKTAALIYGKMYENESTGEESACYKSYKQLIDALFKNDPSLSREEWMKKVQFVDEGNEYIMTFVDKDLRTIDVLKLNPKSPDNDRDPKDALVARDISTAPEYTGLEFVEWLCRVDAKNDDGYEVLRGTKEGDSAFTNIKEDRMFIPSYKFNPSKVVSCGSTHRLNVVGAEYILRAGSSVPITNFNAPIELDCAESITLQADTRNSTGKFLCWTVTCTNNEGDFTYLLTNASGEMTGFQMPHLENADSVVTITAMYSDTATRCEVVVEGGSGSGFYNGGDVVSIAASAPADSRQTFDRWIPDTSNPQVVSFVDSESARTTFVMPQLTAGQRIVIRASYKDFDPMEGDCELEVINGNGSGFYNVGDAVTISAYASNVENEVFDVWVVPNGQDAAPMPVSSATATITMPRSSMGGKITVTATYKQANSGNGGTNPDGTYTVTVNGGTGGGNYQPGATVTITANTAPTGQTFANWTTSTSGVSFANANSNSTTFVMPSSNVTVTANFNGGSTTGKHKVTVNYGSGSGEYEAGATVNITANAPESSSRVFSRWTTSNSGLGFANANAVSTSFVMPAADVTVTANYKTRSSSDDDDDDDSPSRRPGSNTNTTTVDNRPSNSTSTTTSTTGTVSNPASGTSSTSTPSNNNGNRIYITKNGISNTDVASLAVNGSTDNFIVRITESPDATAAVEQALTNTYGSLNGLAYLPMDISLYDSTGQNKISDTTGLNITVTMPIPDVLIQYGGNARVAAADNGALQQITPRFTTIDGIACVSFVPQHFSPYVIYVDTNNLIAGQMYDTTPATGDPIHPKWFAAIGMACVSILLFVMSDGRKRKKYRAA